MIQYDLKTITEEIRTSAKGVRGQRKFCAEHGVDFESFSKFVNGRLPNPTIKLLEGIRAGLVADDEHSGVEQPGSSLGS